MIQKIHYIELWVNDQLVDLESQDSLNLRIDNVLFEPTKAVTRQITYSYTFSVPATPNNNRIFDHANILSKQNKFHMRYKAVVYADGDTVFEGSLTIRRFKDNMYECNLVNIKVNSLDEIFGDAKLSDIPWPVDFDGVPTINSVNADSSTKYYFPFSSYGVFQKRPYHSDEVANDYTSKFTLDKWNRYWVETFYPSLNMLEHVRKAFEWKGYNVLGTAFTDERLSNIFESCTLANEQSPDYNVGNPLFGEVKIRSHFVNSGNTAARWEQDLNFPCYQVIGAPNAEQGANEEEYNLQTVDLWNVFNTKQNPNTTVSIAQKSYVYDPDEQLIVIPKTGWYKIRLNVGVLLNDYNSTFTAQQWKTTYNADDKFEKRNVTLRKEMKQDTPVEIQLVKNYDDNLELIKGKYNVKYMTGDPNDVTYTYTGPSYTGGTYANKVEWYTEYPHQCQYTQPTGTKENGLSVTTTEAEVTKEVEQPTYTGTTNEHGTFGGRRKAFGGDRSGKVEKDVNVIGYMHKSGQLMPYDQAVSPAFICGFSSMGEGQMAVMRNGYSWSKMTAEKNKVFAKMDGMDLVISDGVVSSTTYCQNDYKGSDSHADFGFSALAGEIQCCVWLEKNDVLQVIAVQRNFDTAIPKYSITADIELDITAMTDRTQEQLLGDQSWSWQSTSEFPTQLNLSNFTSNERQITDYINDVATAFNLDIVQNGNEVQINLNTNPINQKTNNVIDIDDRCNSYEAETEIIEYPRKMSVEYKIDTEEWGFQKTVPQEWINSDEWKQHGDYGYSVIDLSDDSYVTSESKTSLNYSYTYYDNFKWKEVVYDSQLGYTETGAEKTIRIPVIEKSEYMADGYGYDEAMKHDGYSMTPRLWYRQPQSEEYVHLADWNHEKVWLSYPINTRNSFNLSYKNTETSILTEYFQLMPLLSSNYTTVEVYLSPNEYRDIVGGARVHFDSDIYIVAEVGAYDATGVNATKLTLIKYV